MSKENEKNQTPPQPAPAVPDWELRREPETESFEPAEPPEDTGREEPETARKRQLNTLQKYLILFFIVALALVIVAGVFQQKLRSSSESYESIIAEKEHSILTNSSMLSDLQEKYDALLKERDSQKELIDSLQAENDANRAEADTLRIQSAAEAALFTITGGTAPAGKRSRGSTRMRSRPRRSSFTTICSAESAENKGGDRKCLI